MSRAKKLIDKIGTKIRIIQQKKAAVHTLYMKTVEDEDEKVKEFCRNNNVSENDTLVIIKE